MATVVDELLVTLGLELQGLVDMHRAGGWPMGFTTMQPETRPQ